MQLEDLKRLEGPAAVQFILSAGEVLRAVVGPADIFRDEVRVQPLRHQSGSWIVQWGGWPAVYSAGRSWRYEIQGESIAIPRASIREALIEEHAWGLTLLSLPATLPPGVLDFVIHHATFGFQNAASGLDDFARPLPRVSSTH